MTRSGHATRVRYLGVIALAGALVFGAACSKKTAEKPAEETTTTTKASATTGTTKAPTTATTKVPTTGTTISGSAQGQWAETATATTSYGALADDGWNASQAIGAPNVKADSDPTGCGDIKRAWASQNRDTVDVLTLGYKTAVIPTEINIYETYNPGTVSKVVVSGPGSQSKTVYETEPQVVSDCPRVLTVHVTGVDFPVDTVAVTIDQTKVANWAEIDAVELVGSTPKTP